MQSITSREMTLDEVKEFYGRTDITQADDGFELYDERMNLTWVVPLKSYCLGDAEPQVVDLKELKVDTRGLVWNELYRDKAELSAPVALRYAFGRYDDCDDGKYKFILLDPMRNNDTKVNAIYVEADWNRRQDAMNTNWVLTMARIWGAKNVRRELSIPGDELECTGTQIWILRIDETMIGMSELEWWYYDWQRDAIIDSVVGGVCNEVRMLLDSVTSADE